MYKVEYQKMDDLLGTEIKVKDFVAIWDPWMSAQVIGVICKVTEKSVSIFRIDRCLHLKNHNLQNRPSTFDDLKVHCIRKISAHHMVVLSPQQVKAFFNIVILASKMSLGEYSKPILKLIDDEYA